MTGEKTILEAIQLLPEDATYEDAIEEIRLLKHIDAGEVAADNSRARSHSEVKTLIRSWIDSAD